jgi:uncharacterized protein (DUF1778 family)
MARTRTNKIPSATTSQMVRLDEDSKAALVRAAELRGISVSDYVRLVAVAQARKEVQGEAEQMLVLIPEEQLAFWKALAEPVRLTEPQKEMGRLMREG